MKTYEEAQQKSKRIYDIFIHIRKEFPHVKLHKSGDDFEYSIFFIGNKISGSKYDLTAWKDIPILKCNIFKYGSGHPTKPNEYFLEMRLNFRGFSSSEDWLMSDDKLLVECRKAFENASTDFLIEEI